MHLRSMQVAIGHVENELNYYEVHGFDHSVSNYTVVAFAAEATTSSQASETGWS